MANNTDIVKEIESRLEQLEDEIDSIILDGKEDASPGMLKGARETLQPAGGCEMRRTP